MIEANRYQKFVQYAEDPLHNLASKNPKKDTKQFEHSCEFLVVRYFKANSLQLYDKTKDN